jgi:hypothetical protein
MKPCSMFLSSSIPADFVPPKVNGNERRLLAPATLGTASRAPKVKP